MRAAPIADAGQRVRHVFLRDLVLLASVGVHAHEHVARQRVRINVDLGVEEGEPGPAPDRLDRVVDYERVASTVRSLVAAEHVKLVETLAERIAAACLADPRVCLARIRVEKLDILPDAEAVGVEVERVRSRANVEIVHGSS